MQHVGEVIKKYREMDKLSVEELAIKSKIDVEKIVEIENTGVVEDDSILIPLSEVLMVDLLYHNMCYKNYIILQNESYYLKLRKAIIERDYEKIKQCMKAYNSMPLAVEKEIKQTTLYGEILLINIFEEDYEKSIRLALEGLGFETIKDLIDYIDENKIVRYEASFYSIMLALGYALFEIGEVEYNKQLYYKIYKQFAKYVSHFEEITEDEKRLFIVLISNASYSLFNVGEYEECLKLCEMGIEKSFKYNKNHMLDYLHKIKTECLYKLSRYEESKENYLLFLKIVGYSKNNRILDELNESIKSEYPLLVECTN